MNKPCEHSNEFAAVVVEIMKSEKETILELIRDEKWDELKDEIYEAIVW